MLGTHVESIDFNLPVDAVTEKPLFAFSCNRIIRESYDGPLVRAMDSTDIYVADLSANVGKQIELLYDQKSRYNFSSNNAVCSGPYPTLRSNESEPLKTGDRVTPLWPNHPYYNQTGRVNSIGSTGFTVDYDTPPDGQHESGGGLDLSQEGTGWEKKIEYWLEFTGTESFSISDSLHLDRAGVLAVCDPEGQGRKPVFTANNGADELSLDVGTAYIRFSLYGSNEKEDLFGGLDYPVHPKNGYVANYDTNILLRSVDGKGGESVATRPLPSFSSMFIGKDMAGNGFEGRIYELLVCDFPVPFNAEQEVFRDWNTFYSLT
jgi:hypothetical protein